MPPIPAIDSGAPSDDPPRWDRLLETTYKHGKDLVLVSGAPPLLRVEFGLRALSTPGLTRKAVDRLLREIHPTELENPEEVAEFADHEEFTLSYGDAAKFRIAALHGEPAHTIYLARMPADAAPQ